MALRAVSGVAKIWPGSLHEAVTFYPRQDSHSESLHASPACCALYNGKERGCLGVLRKATESKISKHAKMQFREENK